MAETTAKEKVEQAIVPKPTRRYRAWLFQGYVIAATVALGVLFVLVWNVPYFTIDLTVTRGIQESTPLWFATLMDVVSLPGSAPQSFALVALVMVILFAVGLRWESMCCLIAGGGGALVDTLAKAFGFLIFLAYSLLKARVAWRSVIIVVLGFFVATIGISRIYLGAHWFSDVLGAYLLGSLWLALSIYVYHWGKPRFFVNQPAAPETPVENRAPVAARRRI